MLSKPLSSIKDPKIMKKTTLLFLFITLSLSAQTDQRIYDIINTISADSIKADIKTLTEFGTRNTFSDTISSTHGIGAARRWINLNLMQFLTIAIIV